MKTSAPGKLVLSGAYAVLRGAPAIVTAVNRRVFADTRRPAGFLAPEVVAGLALLEETRPAPWYDASALRKSQDKLGLGSSAAICAASLGALFAQTDARRPLSNLRKTLFPVALKAHRKAQHGGSGIDVAAACFGGTLGFRLDPTATDSLPELTPVDLPPELVVEVYGCKAPSASTRDFVDRVFSAETSAPREFAAALGKQVEASHACWEALKGGQLRDVILALRVQLEALTDLGELAGIPIVSPQVRALLPHLGPDAAFLPSGAGGGDVHLYVGEQASSAEFREHAKRCRFFPVELDLDAEGFRIEGDE